MDDAKHAADLFFKKVVYGFNTLHFLPIASNIFVSFFDLILTYSLRK